MIRVATAGVIAAMVVGGVYANGVHQASQLRKSQVESCERGNKVRVTLHAFLREAAISRHTLATLTHGRVARENERAALKYARWAKDFHALDCERTIRQP